MVALQTLRGINSKLSMTQNEISTGKQISNAMDSASIWAISKVMESDVKGFKGISETLSLGQSTVAVARNASETVTDLLTEIKGKIVSAQEENVDRDKIQTDIDALRGQISSVVSAAQFNGLNLVQGTEDVNILSSLDRGSDGGVTAANITVTRQDLSTTAGVYGTGSTLAGNVTAADGANALNSAAGNQFSSAGNTMVIQMAGTAVAGEQYNLQIAGITVSHTSVTGSLTAADTAAALTAAINAAGIEDIVATVSTADITITSTSKFDEVEVNASTTGTQTFDLYNGGADATGALAVASATIAARASTVEFSDTAGTANTAGVSEGDGYRVTIGSANYDYIAGKGETFEDVAKGLKLVIDAAALEDISTNVIQDDTTGNWFLQVDNDDATDIAFAVTGAADGEATGGLNGIDSIDVTSNDGADAALANIETLIQNSIDAAASFGSDQGRIDTQSEFVSKMMDSLKTGIGALVDADMEEASARLQALQVQQQLAIQSLSIANQAPQSILSLFR
nr:flagellin [Pseudoruegeria sp. HB172150]